MSSTRRPLAVSLGDPAGVGPELICAAWSERKRHGLPPFAVLGGAKVLQAATHTRGLDMDCVPVAELAEAEDVFDRALPVLGDANTKATFGAPDSDGAALALQSLEEATALAVSGEASGIVTMPVAKGLLAEVGFAFPGQTEFLADRCGLAWDEAVMMLAGPRLRAVPITVHCALVDVPEHLTTERIVRKARIVHRSLHCDFGISAPRLAVAGLNPHAGEDGRMGREEIEIIAPAVAQLAREGLDVRGPIAGDALFTPRARQTYDAALAMYHDQALIPMKALDFDEGVNVTCGLPIVRTSPDHGTAFDIAGQGMADPGATIAALKLAGECAARRGAG